MDIRGGSVILFPLPFSLFRRQFAQLYLLDLLNRLPPSDPVQLFKLWDFILFIEVTAEG